MVGICVREPGRSIGGLHLETIEGTWSACCLRQPTPGAGSTSGPGRQHPRAARQRGDHLRAGPGWSPPTTAAGKAPLSSSRWTTTPAALERPP